MASEAVEHDYHLLPPSPWPFLSGLAATLWGTGMVAFFAGIVDRNAGEGGAAQPMKEFFFARGMDMFGAEPGTVSNGGWILLLLGTMFATYVMVGWWRDVAKESANGEHTPVINLGLRYGMIMFIMQEAMFFVGWFWVFFELGLFHEARQGWNTNILEDAAGYGVFPPNDVGTVPAWNLPLINTLILLLSGTTVTWAHHSLIHGDRKSAKWGLILTVALGLLFTYVQAVEYIHLYHVRETLEGPWLTRDLYGSAFFMATGFHGFHVLIGTIFLAVILLRLTKGGMKPEKHFGFEAAAWYWHFVDVVWLFLFAFLYVAFT